MTEHRLTAHGRAAIAAPTPLAAHAVQHDRVLLTSAGLECDGVPVLPVSGELHYSRVPRQRWEERLRLLRSGGITIVSTYVIWNHHQPLVSEPPRFDDNLDLAAFVRCARASGLDVMLRIGPWSHAEVRHGGLPDDVALAPHAVRTDEPRYLAAVERWWRVLAGQVAPLCGGDGPIVGVQIENELVDDPEHLTTLARLARSLGIVAPVTTATAWMGARLPLDEVMPVWGGYSDGFWVAADAGWPAAFRGHFVPSPVWDDAGLGADVRGGSPMPTALPAPGYPIATCELGGGMATAYHRRPTPSADDVAAVANVKLGSGSSWQGYYMAAGGRNPRAHLQESHASGSPNDMPQYDYDFAAPIGAAGELRPSHALLRRQHALAAWAGGRISRMSAHLPPADPSTRGDVPPLRWSVRADERGGVLMLTWHQPYDALATATAVRFAVEIAGDEVKFPPTGIDIPPGTIARWPLLWPLDAEERLQLRWATASLLTAVPAAANDGPPTVVLAAEHGVPVMLGLDADVRVDEVDPVPGAPRVLPGSEQGTWHVDAPAELLVANPLGARGRLRVLSASQADRAWVLEAPERVLHLTDDDLWTGADGRLVRRQTSAFTPVTAVPGRPARGVPRSYGMRDGRASAPPPSLVAQLAATWRLTIPTAAWESDDVLLQIDWAGDLAELLLDDEVVHDRFWAGTPWLIELRDLGAGPGSRLALRILPLHPESTIALPSAAQRRRAAEPGQLCVLDAVQVATRVSVAG